MPSIKRAHLLFAFCLSFGAVPALDAIGVGQKDTFESGTTEGWAINLVGIGTPPAGSFPQNVSSGGPSGTGDGYLLLNSTGMNAAGGRLTVGNTAQWVGDYSAAGVNSIAMDVRNFGLTDLYLRLMFSDPAVGPPANLAFSTTSIYIPAGSGWTSIAFPILPSQLTAGLGSVEQALMNVTEMRLYHSFDLNHPQPGSSVAPVLATVGIDNIEARGTDAVAVPDSGPSGWFLAVGVLSLAMTKFRKRPLKTPF